jgi:hypothetical protein
MLTHQIKIKIHQKNAVDQVLLCYSELYIFSLLIFGFIGWLVKTEYCWRIEKRKKSPETKTENERLRN